MTYSITLSSEPPTTCSLCGAEPAYLSDRKNPFCIICAVGNLVVLHLLVDRGQSNEEEIKEELRRVGHQLLEFYSERS